MFYHLGGEKTTGRGEEGSLLVSCARATRGRRLPRWTRAVEDQSAPIPEELTSELGGIICNLARRPQLEAPHTLASGVMKWKRKCAPLETTFNAFA